MTITTSKYHPQSKPPAYTPLAPSDTANAVPAPSRRELWGCCVSTLDLWELEVPAVNPSVKNQRFLPAPFGKGAFLCPVSFHCAIPGFFRPSIDSVGTNRPKNHNLKRVQRLKPRTRAKAKGQSRLVPPGGFSRGEQFERERVAPPLSRLLCFLSCRSKKGRPRWQAPGVPPVSISLGS